MRRGAVIGLALLAASLLGERPAGARARHEDESVRPWKEKGSLVGFILKLTLRPDNDSYGSCQVGLGCRESGKVGGDKRRAAWDPKVGYLLWHSPWITGLAKKPAETVEYKVRFDQKLTPGRVVDVITAWRSSASGGSPHVWGMAHGPVTNSTKTLTLPRGPSGGARVAKASSARPRGRAAQRPARARAR